MKSSGGAASELRMQTNKPLRQRLGIVAHGVYRSGTDRDMAVPDVEAVEAWERADSAVTDGSRNGGRLKLCDLVAAIEHTHPVQARLFLIDVEHSLASMLETPLGREIRPRKVVPQSQRLVSDSSSRIPVFNKRHATP